MWEEGNSLKKSWAKKIYTQLLQSDLVFGPIHGTFFWGLSELHLGNQKVTFEKAGNSCKLGNMFFLLVTNSG